MSNERIKRSWEVYSRAKQVIPGIAQLISRRPSRAALGVSPIYAHHGKDCRIWDLDGNEYVDWHSGYGPIILGYCDPVVDAAVKDQIGRGAIYSILEEGAVHLAEELRRVIPSAEMVRFCKGGGEACAIAVRIARAYTGRDKVLFCGYHGWHDWYLAANLEGEKLSEHLFNGIEPLGVPRSLVGTVKPFSYGNIEVLSNLLEENSDQIACIIMEPMRSEDPPPGYLQGVRQLADRHNVVLIFDEVSTGFRIALGGAQEYTGVTPDMTTFAKALSNGYALGAVVGQRDCMALAEKLFISSAYWDDNIGVIAGIATLKELQRREAANYFVEVGSYFKSRINEAASVSNVSVRCGGTSAFPKIYFDIKDPILLKKIETLFTQENARQGFLLSGGIFLNLSHNYEIVDRTTQAVINSFNIIDQALERENIDDVLEVPVQSELFGRMVE
ncbi:MAG: aminotransferase class III-fold pyridoxal phosphate-dependent enzyme [Candidatus Latescibacterota bacterium]|nr:aminotransferase class III-fold pyridoxal phosphate-dependent enzyme [Candidatus Latescibacterota bacterium]